MASQGDDVSLLDKKQDLQISVARRRKQYSQECASLLAETLKMDKQILFNAKYEIGKSPELSSSGLDMDITEKFKAPDFSPSMFKNIEEKLVKVETVLDQIERHKNCTICHDIKENV